MASDITTTYPCSLVFREEKLSFLGECFFSKSVCCLSILTVDSVSVYVKQLNLWKDLKNKPSRFNNLYSTGSNTGVKGQAVPFRRLDAPSGSVTFVLTREKQIHVPVIIRVKFSKTCDILLITYQNKC